MVIFYWFEVYCDGIFVLVEQFLVKESRSWGCVKAYRQ
jgi:hypothetical protein